MTRAEITRVVEDFFQMDGVIHYLAWSEKARGWNALFQTRADGYFHPVHISEAGDVSRAN